MKIPISTTERRILVPPHPELNTLSDFPPFYLTLAHRAALLLKIPDFKRALPFPLSFVCCLKLAFSYRTSVLNLVRAGAPRDSKHWPCVHIMGLACGWWDSRFEFYFILVNLNLNWHSYLPIAHDFISLDYIGNYIKLYKQSFKNAAPLPWQRNHSLPFIWICEVFQLLLARDSLNRGLNIS